jgi:hypothetical protein
VIRVADSFLIALATVSCAGSEVPSGGTARQLAPGEFRAAAMDLLQSAARAQMHLYRSAGHFTERPKELSGARGVRFVVTSGIGAPGRVSVETCEEDRVVVLGTEAGDGSVFAVKLRGASADAVFSHYTEDPLCDVTDGPGSWPNGYRLSEAGLVQKAGN